MNVVNKLKPSYIKAFIKSKQYKYLLDKQYKVYKNKKKFLLIGTPSHGNLGDQAITIAELKFLEDNFQNYDVIEISLDNYYEHIEYVKKYVTNKDLVFIHGGGNLGNEYLFDENIRRDAIKRFPENKIILFPQTIYFSKDKSGTAELQKSKKIYNAHNNLTLIAREKLSYEIMKKEFNKCNVLLCPDIVFYLCKIDRNVKRQGALCCLRNDIEAKLTEYDRKYIIEKLNKSFKRAEVTDTIVKHRVDENNRNEVLQEKLYQFQTSELVITDRIHGMIFAAITGTPCVALSNYNHKVKGTYNWIKHLNNIYYTEDISHLDIAINKVLSSRTDENTEIINRCYFSDLMDVIKEGINENNR